MRSNELRPKNKKELSAILQEKRQRLDELRFMLYQKKIKNVREVREVKKDIARILTLLRK